jgi:hypothetical protein
MPNNRHCCISATHSDRSETLTLSRRRFLAAGIMAALWPPRDARAVDSNPIPLPRPVLYDGSSSAYLAWGESSFVRDLSTSPSYGGPQTFVLRSDGGRPPQPEERDAQRRLENKAAKIIAAGTEIIPRLLALAHEAHVRNRSAPASAPVEDAQDALLNLASRASACGDVATALSVLLNRAGIRTRILMLAQEATGLGRADHVTLEAFSPGMGRWVLLEGMLGIGPVKGGGSGHPTSGFLDLTGDSSARAALNKAHGRAYYTERTGFAAVLPDPDYSRPVEVLWVPTRDAANRFMSERFGQKLGE